MSFLKHCRVASCPIYSSEYNVYCMEEGLFLIICQKQKIKEQTNETKDKKFIYQMVNVLRKTMISSYVMWSMRSNKGWNHVDLQYSNSLHHHNISTILNTTISFEVYFLSSVSSNWFTSIHIKWVERGNIITWTNHLKREQLYYRCAITDTVSVRLIVWLWQAETHDARNEFLRAALVKS